MLDPSRLIATRSREEVREELKIQPEQRAIAFMGEMLNRNNPYALIQAVKALNEESPEEERYVAVFVGEGNNILEAHQYASAHLGIEGPFRFLGARGDTADILAAVDVVLAPAVYPNAGHDVLQAWAAGVPVVGTWVGPVAGHSDSRGAMLLVPRAIEKAPKQILHMQFQQEAIAEKVASSYAEAIAEVFTERDATAVRIERGRELLAERYDPAGFGERWTARLLKEGGFPAPEGQAPEADAPTAVEAPAEGGEATEGAPE
jgi:glycosyltransferase involved in cell wall biosynthesis